MVATDFLAEFSPRGETNRIDLKTDSVVLLAGELMSQEAYERYLDGSLSQDELRRVHRLLSEWGVASEFILDMIRR